jgi:cbb3-type cytochrome oxidase subunit 1
MNRIAGNFMKAAVVYGMFGFALGVYMGASHEYALLSTHSHLGLLGWVTFALCALYYQQVPAAAGRKLATVHFWTANAGLIVLAFSLVLKSRGIASAEPGAAAGSVLSFAALAMFFFIVCRTSGKAA